jgi:hypothetical protein
MPCMYRKHLAIATSCHRGASDGDREGGWGKYQFQPAHVWFILQVLSEVEVVHVLIDEPERYTVPSAQKINRVARA